MWILELKGLMHYRYNTLEKRPREGDLKTDVHCFWHTWVKTQVCEKP